MSFNYNPNLHHPKFFLWERVKYNFTNYLLNSINIIVIEFNQTIFFNEKLASTQTITKLFWRIFINFELG